MEKNLKELQPLNEDKFFEEFEPLEEDARRERLQNIIKERNDILDSNRKLFGRAKEAEGFKQDEDGNWIKTIEKKPEAKKTDKSDDKLLERFNKLARKTAGVVEDDEVEFFNKWKKDNGYENIDDDEVVIGKKGFQTEFADFRTAKANLAATSNIKGEKGELGVKNTPEYWIAKATKGADGKPVFPEETPPELFPAILAKLGENEPGANKGKLKFHNT